MRIHAGKGVTMIRTCDNIVSITQNVLDAGGKHNKSGRSDHSRFQRRPQSGFTLIELLVVVSIIALLVAILMPALNKARMMAKRQVCSSHLHSIGLALACYEHDNNYRLPPQVNPSGGRKL